MTKTPLIPEKMIIKVYHVSRNMGATSFEYVGNETYIFRFPANLTNRLFKSELIQKLYVG